MSIDMRQRLLELADCTDASPFYRADSSELRAAAALLARQSDEICRLQKLLPGEPPIPVKQKD